MKHIAALSCLTLASWLALVGCSFDVRPMIGSQRSPTNPSASGDRSNRAPSGAGSAAQEPSDGGSQDARAPGDARPPDPTTDAATRPPPAGAAGAAMIGGRGGSGGTGGSSGSGGNPEPDASVPDTSVPECPQELPPCVCGHTRLQTPADPCAAPDCPLAECAPDADCTLERFESSVYYVCTDGHSQQDALAHCAEIDGMHLVYIGSPEEDAFLNDVIDGKVWIGAAEDEGVWSWLDGTDFYDDGPVADAYVNWDDSANEPNSTGVGMGEVTCAILWSETGAWADTNCPAMNGFVCEREL